MMKNYSILHIRLFASKKDASNVINSNELIDGGPTDFQLLILKIGEILKIRVLASIFF